jgi:hypothetical protein
MSQCHEQILILIYAIEEIKNQYDTSYSRFQFKIHMIIIEKPTDQEHSNNTETIHHYNTNTITRTKQHAH